MDELKKIEDVTNKFLMELLFTMVPEYQLYYEQENNVDDLFIGRYLFMNDFASFLSDEIIQNPQSVIVSKAFNFINKIGESDNLEVLNVVRVGILEILYTKKNLNRDLVLTFLSEKMQKYFKELSSSYY